MLHLQHEGPPPLIASCLCTKIILPLSLQILLVNLFRALSNDYN